MFWVLRLCSILLFCVLLSQLSFILYGPFWKVALKLHYEYTNSDCNTYSWQKFTICINECIVSLSRNSMNTFALNIEQYKKHSKSIEFWIQNQKFLTLKRQKCNNVLYRYRRCHLNTIISCISSALFWFSWESVRRLWRQCLDFVQLSSYVHVGVLPSLISEMKQTTGEFSLNLQNQ